MPAPGRDTPVTREAEEPEQLTCRRLYVTGELFRLMLRRVHSNGR